jgi:tetratricopeptide (TPR) repeat protein
MQAVTPDTVLGNFNNTSFTYAGLETRFLRRGDAFIVRTEGPDGKIADYEVAYTFGYYPLQQYLIAFPGGRYQALSICWDTRPKALGGQRWFHLYPQEKIRAGDFLHWTSLSQNWNYQCAECHSTDLRKNFDAATNRYETTWSEVNVSCEACHGPASHHVEWAHAARDGNAAPPANKGFVFALTAAEGALWAINPATGIADRSRPRASHAEIETCARCHSRRSTLTDAYIFGRPLADTHRAALLDSSLYFPDGQIEDEVYEYGSFLQSRMFAKGVTCSDCHDPHELRLSERVDQTCARCHLPAKFASPAHHHHRLDSPGASCVECHMPSRTYMVIDRRRDHSFRVPRPDLSVSLGTPNACSSCHADKPAAWAAAAAKAWFGSVSKSSQPHYASAIQPGRTAGIGAERALVATASNPETPAIVRATTLSLLASMLSPVSLETVESGLADSDPMVRAAAAEALSGVDEATRARMLAPLFADPVRLVRINAARSSAAVRASLLTDEQSSARTRALEEFVAVQREAADAPGSHINLGALYAEQGNPDGAKAEFETALKIQPMFVPASINLADVFRVQGRDDEGEKVLRAAIGRTPDQADLHHALGLLLVRAKRLDEAVDEFRRAAVLDPTDRRGQYVLGVALYSTGRMREAIETLERANTSHPGDREILAALVSYHRELGHVDRALEYARQLLNLSPTDEAVRRLVAQLEAAGGSSR